MPPPPSGPVGNATNTGFDLRFGSLGDQGLFSNPRSDATVADPPSLQSQFSNLYSGALPQGLNRFEEQPQLGVRGTATAPNPPGAGTPFYSAPARESHPGGGHRRVDLEEYLEATSRMSAPQLSEIFSRMNMENPASSPPSKG